MGVMQSNCMTKEMDSVVVPSGRNFPFSASDMMVIWRKKVVSRVEEIDMKWASETKRETYLIRESVVNGDGFQPGSDEGISHFASIHCRHVSDVEQREKRTKWKDICGRRSAGDHVDTRNFGEKFGVDG